MDPLNGALKGTPQTTRNTKPWTLVDPLKDPKNLNPKTPNPKPKT